MSRLNLTLALVLVAQLALFGSAYLLCGGPGEGRTQPVRLLGGIQREEISRVTIEDADGRSVALVRKDGAWVLESHSEYPADPEKVSKLLGNLAGLESSIVVSRGTEHHVELEVAEKKYQRKVQMDSDSGARKLILGKTGRGGMVNARVGDDPTVYASDGLRVWQLGTRVADWAKTTYVQIDKDRVVSLSVKTESAQVSLSRMTKNEWRFQDKPVNQLEATKLLDKVAKLELSGVWGKADKAEEVRGGKKPVVVSLGLAADHLLEKPEPPPDGGGEEILAPEVVDQKILTLAEHPEKTTAVLAYLEGSDYVVEVDRWRVEELFGVDPAKLYSAPSQQ